jgi:hypothetical protein
MKKVFIFIITFTVIISKIQASGEIYQPPLFKVYKKFGHFIKAVVIGKKVEVDSSGNNKICLVLLVKESFISKVNDTLNIGPVMYNDSEYTVDGFQHIFMDIHVDSTYYFGLGKDYYLSPYLPFNKIEIINNHLNYNCYTRIDDLLRRNIFFYFGKKMKVEKFERKLRRRMKG